MTSIFDEGYVEPKNKCSDSEVVLLLDYVRENIMDETYHHDIMCSVLSERKTKTHDEIMQDISAFIDDEKANGD